MPPELARLLRLFFVPLLSFGGGDDSAKAAEEEAKQREEELQKQYEEQLAAYQEAMAGMMEMSMPEPDANESQKRLQRLRKNAPQAITATEPATTTNQAEVLAAEEQARLDQLRKRGLLSTIQAGETGSLLTTTLGNSSTLA